MFDLILLLIGLVYLDHIIQNSFGFVYKNHVYTRKGLIQIPTCKYFGPVFVLRYPQTYVLIKPGQILKLNREILSSKYRLTYVLDFKVQKCPYEIGPPLILPKGQFIVSMRVQGLFGGKWNTINESTKWPIDNLQI